MVFICCALAACGKSPSHAPLAPGSTVLAFGDSVTYGVGAGTGEDYPTLLAQDTGWTVGKAGISGDTAQNAKHRLGELLARHQPDLVLVELGGNDFLRKRQPAEVKADLLAILRESVSSGAVTVLIAVPRLSIMRASMGMLSDSPIYAEPAEATGALLVPDIFADILSDDRLRADRIHPNAIGYRQFTDELLDALADAGLTP